MIRHVARAIGLWGALAEITGAAHAADLPVAGSQLRWQARGEQSVVAVTLDLRDPAIDPTQIDPTVDGVRISVLNPTPCRERVDRDIIVLPAAGWQRRPGNRPRFEFRQRAADGEPRRATWKAGRFSLRGAFRSELDALVANPQGTVGIELHSGSLRACSTFGGTVLRDEPGAFRAADAPRPLACLNVVAPVCADGVLSCAEACDDGNLVNGDGCSSLCEVEMPGVCGDGHIDLGETCDDGHPYDGGPCPASCRIETCPGVTGGERSGRVTLSTGPSTPALGAVVVLLDYPEALASLPGIGNAPASRVRLLPFPATFGVDDLDYAVRLQAVGLTPLQAGDLFEVAFDECTPGIPAPLVVPCRVESAQTPLGDGLDPDALATLSCSFAAE
jgi:cysteine-rich repeat protein